MEFKGELALFEKTVCPSLDRENNLSNVSKAIQFI